MAVEEIVGVLGDKDHSEAVECKKEKEEEAVVLVALKDQEIVTIVENQGTSSSTVVSVNKKRDQGDAY